MVAESYRAEVWLYATLAADTGVGGVNHATTGVGGRIYAYLAPASAITYPMVIYNLQGAHDLGVVGAIRVWNSMIYNVQVIGKGAAPNFGAIKAIADRIDALLHAASGTTTDGRILSCVREQDISYVEVNEGNVYAHLGGLYRLQVRPR